MEEEDSLDQKKKIMWKKITYFFVKIVFNEENPLQVEETKELKVEDQLN